MRIHHSTAFFRPTRRSVRTAFSLLLAMTAGSMAGAQTQPAASPPRATGAPSGWQVCQAMVGEQSAQLKCFQDWAAAQTPAQRAPLDLSTTPPQQAAGVSAAPFPLPPLLNTKAPDGKPIGCRNDKYSALSRFWELQRGADCDNFSLRAYRPITLAVVTSDSVNSQPSSPAVGHTAATAQAYSRNENKIQLSVRTKIAKGLFKRGPKDEDDQDSLWFGYTQQSYWQLFNGAISRPFRSTDHEPEAIYIYPHQIPLGGGWDYRLSGLGVVHQSNGQSLPLSRSWNRVYLWVLLKKPWAPTPT